LFLSLALPWACSIVYANMLAKLRLHRSQQNAIEDLGQERKSNQPGNFLLVSSQPQLQPHFIHQHGNCTQARDRGLREVPQRVHDWYVNASDVAFVDNLTHDLGQVTANYGKGYPEAHKWSVVFEKKNEMYFAYAIVYHKVDEPLDWAIVQESWACPTRVEAPESLMEDAIYEFTVSKK